MKLIKSSKKKLVRGIGNLFVEFEVQQRKKTDELEKANKKKWPVQLTLF